jgi:hypothetical protein
MNWHQVLSNGDNFHIQKRKTRLKRRQKQDFEDPIMHEISKCHGKASSFNTI